MAEAIPAHVRSTAPRKGPHRAKVETAVVAVLDGLLATGAIDATRFGHLQLAAWPAFHGVACLIADEQINPAQVDIVLAAVGSVLLAGRALPERPHRAIQPTGSAGLLVSEREALRRRRPRD
jgi:hypothetical protein